MRLTDLGAAFFHLEPHEDGGSSVVRQPEITGATGVVFDDPCRPGARIHIYFENPVGTPPEAREAKRWQREGVSLDALTLTPSIFINPHATPPGAHFFVRTGSIDMV